MSRRVRIEIDLDELPREVTESIRLTLKAHSYTIAFEHERGLTAIEELGSVAINAVLDELGRNAVAPLGLAEPEERCSVEEISKLMRSWCSNWSEAEISAVTEDLYRLMK